MSTGSSAPDAEHLRYVVSEIANALQAAVLAASRPTPDGAVPPEDAAVLRDALGRAVRLLRDLRPVPRRPH